MRGLRTAGVDVIDIGLAATPMLYFATTTVCASGIQVTATTPTRPSRTTCAT